MLCNVGENDVRFAPFSPIGCVIVCMERHNKNIYLWKAKKINYRNICCIEVLMCVENEVG